MARAVTGSGAVGSRISWVRLGSTSGVPVYLVGVYVPHHARAQPAAEDTLEDLRQLLESFPPRAVVSVLGDFNAWLARNVPSLTGNWSVHRTSNTMGDMLAEFMGEQELTDVSTFFKPRRKFGGGATYKPFGEDVVGYCGLGCARHRSGRGEQQHDGAC